MLIWGQDIYKPKYVPCSIAWETQIAHIMVEVDSAIVASLYGVWLMSAES